MKRRKQIMVNMNYRSKEKTVNNSNGQLHIVFLHLDLGIGGAEQLVINLALASLANHHSTQTQSDKVQTANKRDNNESTSSLLNAKVSIFTTHCDQSHCFDAVQKNSNPPGILAPCVHVVGSFLPVHLFGKGTAFCSTIRMFYLSIMARRMYPNADVIVLDGLPSPIPYLVSLEKRRSSPCVVYYCHFPDKLLTRDTVNGERFVLDSSETSRQPSPCSSNNKMGVGVAAVGINVFLKNQYRKILDAIEEWAMSYADLVCVNSQFTRKQVLGVFPSLDSKLCRRGQDKMRVLYPAIDLNKFVTPDFEKKQQILAEGQLGQMPIVSLNRFERKKNIQVLLYAYASMWNDWEQDNKDNSSSSSHKSGGGIRNIPPLIIAGGYDVRNMENVEYLKELKHLANRLGIEDHTVFKPSVSDDERAMLLQSALCVVYTPHREHFGIVPLEAMYAGSAVVAMKSGGPEETVQDGITGILVDMTPNDTCKKLANAICSLLDDPKKAIEMGKCGHEHVKKNFGMDPFRQEWSRLVLHEAIPRGKERLRNVHDSIRTSTIFWWCLGLFLAFCVWWLRWIMASS